jgi:hypothetical protein
MYIYSCWDNSVVCELYETIALMVW